MTQSRFMPEGIASTPLAYYLSNMPESMKLDYRDCLTLGYRFYIVQQRRGRCYYQHRVITVPVWAINDKRPGYKFWYLAHEISHATAYIKYKHHGHGAPFMAELKRICPAIYWHYETGYKPKNAVSAGITQCPYVNTGTVPSDF